MKKILTILLSVLSLASVAQNIKKVAILETVDKEGVISYGIKLQIRSSLTFAINRTEGYEGFDRVDMAQISGEQSFQRTGMVSDDQIKQLGIMTGAQYVLIAEAARYDDERIIISAKVLDVETGGVANSASPVITYKDDPDKMNEACTKVAETLMGEDIRQKKELENKRKAEEQERLRAIEEAKARERAEQAREQEIRAQQQEALRRQQEKEQLEESLDNLGNAITDLVQAVNSYTLVVRNYLSQPYKIILDGKILGVVNPYKAESFRLPLDAYGKFQAVQTKGYLLSPSIYNGQIPRQQKGATYTINLKK